MVINILPSKIWII